MKYPTLFYFLATSRCGIITMKIYSTKLVVQILVQNERVRDQEIEIDDEESKKRKIN